MHLSTCTDQTTSITAHSYYGENSGHQFNYTKAQTHIKTSGQHFHGYERKKGSQ